MSADAGTSVVRERSQRSRRSTAASSHLSRRRWWVVPVGIFLSTRVIDGVLLALLGRSQLDPTTLSAPSPGRPPLETGRSYAELVANWDGQWYRYVVEHGYPAHLPVMHGVVQENQWAFYPLYPALVRAITELGVSFGIAASLVSITFGALAMCMLYRYLLPPLGGFGAGMSVLALCIAPAGVIWQAAYAESLALFLVIAALVSLNARRYWLFLAIAVALSLTRPVVLPLALVATVHWCGRWRRRQIDPFPRPERVRLVLVTLATVGTFLIWPAIAGVVSGHANAFLVTRRAWRSNDMHGESDWFLGLLTGNLALVIVLPLALAILIYLVLRRAGRSWGPELRAWALVYPAYVLASTTPTTSIFRYAMLGIVPLWPFPEIGQQVRSTRERCLLAALVCLIGVGIQLAWMRWFFVVSNATIERP